MVSQHVLYDHAASKDQTLMSEELQHLYGAQETILYLVGASAWTGTWQVLNYTALSKARQAPPAKHMQLSMQ